MTMRAPFDPDSAATSLIDKRIGSAFDKVNAVADALGTVIYVANNLGAILGIGAPGGLQSFNVKQFGAKGDGTTNDIEAIQAALTSAKNVGGGVVYFPGGPSTEYLINKPMVGPSNVILWGPGRPKIKASSGAVFTKAAGVQYFPPTTNDHALLFVNEKSTYPIDPDDRDENIVIDGLTFDFGGYGGGYGSGSAVAVIGVKGLTIRNCQFYAGPSAEVATGRMGDAVASLGCEDVLIEDCKAYWFRNCGYDFWSSPRNITLRRCYYGSTDSLQMVNFNPETEPSVGGYLANQSAIGFTMTECTLEGLGATSRPCQIERLSAASTNAYVENIVITHNTFINANLVMRGDVRKALIADNRFYGYPESSTNVIRIFPNHGGTPENIIISRNQIVDPGTLSNQFGVINCQTNSAVITNNVIMGDTYTGDPLYVGSYKPSHSNNYFQKLGLTGRMRGGFVLDNPNNSNDNSRACVGWVDLDGDALRMYMNGNFHEFHSTYANGTPRQVWSLQANNDVSQLNLMIGLLLSSGILRVSPALDLVATGNSPSGALNLTNSFNEVVTVGAGTGVRLPASGATSNSGMPVVVFNRGVNTLNVFPPGGGYIDGLAADEPDTIPAGDSKAYYAARSTHYYTW